MMEVACAMPKYEKLSDALALEESVLRFWEQAAIFRKSLEQTKDKKPYVFYEGPPTANGKPHVGHLMARVNKDLFPRYWTMKGYYVLRKGGWDTHGLPVELEVEKSLGLQSKAEIEKFGIDKFAQKCRESVWMYKSEWERFIRRMGFWIDLENAYITYTDEYIESVWWALKRIWEKGLLYKGHKVLPYCPRCGTALSSHEVAQGYETTKDPSIFFALKAQDPADSQTFFLVWTTTPWTVPSNVALAVGPTFTYAKVKIGDEFFILAKDLVEAVIKDPHEIVETFSGAELVGMRYEPAYKLSDDPNAYRVVAADFVSLEDGTGIVHIAPAFGEEDYQLGQIEKLPFVNPVDLEGKFTERFALAQGQFVKDADAVIIQDLKQRGLLYKSGKYEHEYPFCWRCKTPLLYYARDSYFIKTTAKQREIIENNKHIHWHPEHFRDGRFGNFLETMKDWALSRDRYWGTPLPLWVCERCQREHCVGSRQELIDLALEKEKARAVEFHRPWIDEILLRCSCGGTMRRVPYVIDCWFDSGMMHTAQWHYPFENQEIFQQQFPADFIAEGVDQTRGWFYSLLVTSTLLYEDHPYPHPFKHVVVNLMGLDAQGRKMSKSLGNVIDPWDMISKFGADAVRWYFYSSSAPWKDKRLSLQAVADFQGPLETLKNVYNFFALYAGIDKFDPTQHKASVGERTLLDRWILSRLQATIQTATQSLDDYDIVGAADALKGFIDDLSNWYVRNSRARFWGSAWTADKRAAFATLYEVLLELVKLMAPFVPFLTEAIYQNLRTAQMPESVHLCAWPQVNESLRDPVLENQMAVARQVVTAGLQARNKAQIKVRQPLSCAVVLSDAPALSTEYQQLIAQELNVKRLEWLNQTMSFEFYTPKLEYEKSALGKDLRGFAPKVMQVLEQLNKAEHDRRVQLAQELKTQKKLRLRVDGQEVELLAETHVRIVLLPREGYVEGAEGTLRVLLDTRIDEALRQEGLVREFVRLVQECRKEAGFEVSDRIELYYEADPDVQTALEKFASHVQEETLAVTLQRNGSFERAEFSKELNVNGYKAKIGLVRKR
ncbi:MAG: isoleucine--tRNA ligase [Candidatus Bipolaricaulota bacterium]|nr:isoleucine--tRNA ligase [Candidatus Bipolaricaulota bacterium]MCS7274085.1 isoleucine--tRNA ligase [Candidatus Bipolaricaulota bacterium]MDW8110682.1 isoleucine--tRNA ligase [Candidatus Bipolaricaulota bacterium]MDW8328460.1 isoleucine--tRNA ligase [Candidatus Bipolaricaulota bacterium]